MEKEKVFEEAVRQWGIDIQCAAAIEEMAELIKELSKLKRAGYTYSDETIKPLAGELADVRLILDQIAYIFKINTEEIYEQKLNKVAGRLGLK